MPTWDNFVAACVIGSFVLNLVSLVVMIKADL